MKLTILLTELKTLELLIACTQQAGQFSVKRLKDLKLAPCYFIYPSGHTRILRIVKALLGKFKWALQIALQFGSKYYIQVVDEHHTHITYTHTVITNLI